MRLVLALIIGALAGAPALAADTFDIAITVDDVPAHGTLPQGMTRLSIAQAHIDAFKAHRVSEVYGFVNSAKIDADPASEAVLDLWRKAGHPLGNHTATHLNLTRAASMEAWIADLKAGEPVVAKHMVGADWHWLRFPNLAVGDEARRVAARDYMKANGYRFADVSVAFNDWNYTDAYTRCLAKGDTATIEAMKVQYLKEVEDGIVRMKAVSNRVYGRVIPQVLLTHIGGWSGMMLPQVLDRLDAAGARYVTLAAATSDEAYTKGDIGGGSLLDRAAKAKGISLADIPGPKSSSDVKNLCQ